MSQGRIFHVIIIRPTRYGRDGYPLRWGKAFMPSNSLTCIYALVDDCKQRQVLGPDVDIQIHPIDETSKRVEHRELIDLVKKDNGRGMVMMVGVQSNQFPRAVDLSAQFVDEDVPVLIGGFHVSGTMALLGDHPPEIKAALESGISLFAGEAEDRRLDGVLQDAFKGELQSVYNYLGKLPNLEGEPVPFLPRKFALASYDYFTTFDLGRGCPFGCSFCTVINVQGRKSRFRSADDLTKIVDKYEGQGRTPYFFLTDDNFARNKNWPELLESLIELRKEHNTQFRLIIQTDTRAHNIPGFIEKCVEAGVDQIFIGLENINPVNLAEVKKSHNNIEEYRQSMLAWKKFPVVIYAGYIIGFQNDTRESVLRDIDTIKRELPIDILHFTILTPLPGSADHKDLYEKGEWMDPDLNKYNLGNRVTNHPHHSPEEWDEIYGEAYDRFYTDDHIKTILKRMTSLGSNKKLTTIHSIMGYKHGYREYGIHPLEVGYLPKKIRTDRRPGLPLENPVLFYSKHYFDVVRFYIKSNYELWKLKRILKPIWTDPKRFEYSDEAIAEAKQKN